MHTARTRTVSMNRRTSNNSSGLPSCHQKVPMMSHAMCPCFQKQQATGAMVLHAECACFWRQQAQGRVLQAAAT